MTCWIHEKTTSSIIQPGNYNCDSYYIVYLLMGAKCDSGNYIGETSNKLQFRLNYKKSFGDYSRGFPVAVHFNQPDHSHKKLRCVILRGDFKTTTDRFICEQTLIHELKRVKMFESRLVISIAVQIRPPVLTTFMFYFFLGVHPLRMTKTSSSTLRVGLSVDEEANA